MTEDTKQNNPAYLFIFGAVPVGMSLLVPFEALRKAYAPELTGLDAVLSPTLLAVLAVFFVGQFMLCHAVSNIGWLQAYGEQGAPEEGELTPFKTKESYRTVVFTVAIVIWIAAQVFLLPVSG